MGSVSKGSGTGVSQFAAEVVARLAKRDGTSDPVLRETLVLHFMQAVSATDPQAFEALKPELKRARVTAAVLADHYIPEVARRLGRGWLEDCVSFAEVTMGAARLQAILRGIGQNWFADACGQAGGPAVLVILPAGEQHTLGAMVLAGQLRRMGVSVSLRIGDTPQEAAAFVQGRTFDAALISIACHGRVDACRALVAALKTATGGALKIAVGGAIFEQGEAAVAPMGADVVTNDIGTAMAALGLHVQVASMLELA